MADSSFGAVLRQYRIAASLTQEELAARSALIASAIAALERGRRQAPRPHTVRQLARALGLEEARFDVLVGAVSGQVPAGGIEPPRRADRPATEPPAPSASRRLGLPGPAARRSGTVFTGRTGELSFLSRCWARHRQLVLVIGEAGIGKTRLTAEFARGMHDQGTTVLWGRCEEERAGPYLRSAAG